MGKKNPFSGLEDGLNEANREYIQWNRNDNHRTKIKVLKVVKKIVNLMKLQSPAFAKLEPTIFGNGSSFEGLKVGQPDEFDIDILLTLPGETQPEVKTDTIPGFVQLQLLGFDNLAQTDPELYRLIFYLLIIRVMSEFVDDDNYLLTTQMKSSFMQSIFDKTRDKYFSNGVIKGDHKKITRAQNKGPALTLTIDGFNLLVTIDLVPCFVLTNWPQNGFRPNPFPEIDEFFIVPKEPKREHPHLERYWRLSFQEQERELMFDKKWMKPTIRVMKCLRDHFKHKISSYAIKTLFFWQDQITPDLWRGPLSHCLVYMLERYLRCLEDKKIPYFWYSKLDLLDNLTDSQKEQYRDDVQRMLNDIKGDPTAETILTYFG
ncbi:cyclic GMP-AMP synthase-like [Tribolium madens]|uniref:cyclic GMP-AMP synthase-like n=1 Tax=Tribolium madens TaxID=41895 RepID=UPI001CF75DD1|nr:cyclic GMP-AMP synthase-like [Tribolium madens]XP_044271615.1 cyclic GMP-AMP synthase-like [Tribolium madens]XP_044271624.1 cyclic GMP-AMP synthase-like [Tribolium madens]XP_044271633.1 cyclic GMP-AMP synthase-like [Tribolium madens]